MKRCVVQFTGGEFCNIEADRLVAAPSDEHIIMAMKGEEIVGVFDLGCVLAIYLSEVRK